jgi:hypothetical protein
VAVREREERAVDLELDGAALTAAGKGRHAPQANPSACW